MFSRDPRLAACANEAVLVDVVPGELDSAVLDRSHAASGLSGECVSRLPYRRQRDSAWSVDSKAVGKDLASR